MIKMKTLDLVLLIVGILTLAFIVVMLVSFWHFGSIPDTLCTCFFACVGSECGICGWIKTTKERQLERKWQLEDEKRAEEKRKEEDKKLAVGFGDRME